MARQAEQATLRVQNLVKERAINTQELVKHNISLQAQNEEIAAEAAKERAARLELEQETQRLGEQGRSAKRQRGDRHAQTDTYNA